MQIAVPRESAPGELRVALVPESVTRLAATGLELRVEAGAGARAGYTDEAYRSAGATIVAGRDELLAAAIVTKVQKPDEAELAALGEGTLLIAFLQPLTDTALRERLQRAGVTGFALEAVPRITRAQSMDALSSQSTVAGYKAVLVAADRLPRFFPMLMTAAGTVAPAKLLVLGAGVAGLQAIATGRRLGAVVSAFDTRPAVKEQVESLGARFVEIDVQGEEAAGGYAAAQSDEQQRLQGELLAREVSASDVVVTTALVPGRPAPRLVSAETIASMRPGSVIVDLAAEAGGNCEGTVPGEEIVRDGVTIVGFTDLPSRMAGHASQLLSRNFTAILGHLVVDGELRLDFDDEITAAACITGRQVAA